jgi:hypothetical protein
VGVRLRARRAAGVELADEDLEVVQRARREQELAAEDPEGERGTLVTPEDAGRRRSARLEQVGDADAERARDAPEGGDAGACLAALDLAEEALADLRAVGDRLERRTPRAANRSQPFADVDLGDRFGRARGNCRPPSTSLQKDLSDPKARVKRSQRAA